MSETRSEDAIARRNQRRQARRVAARTAAGDYRARPRLPSDQDQRKAVLDARREAKRAAKASIPFVGCDGEGTTNRGKHTYALFRIGDRELYRGGRRLTTPELLSFILASPPPSEAILVGFAFEYDVCNILVDIPREREKEDQPSRMERILYRNGDAYGFPWTWVNFDGFREFGIAYLPRHFLKVCWSCEVTAPDGTVKRKALGGSVRVIYDTWGMFQGPFLRAIENWQVGEKHWKEIAANKRRRSSFRKVTDRIRSYCALECTLLSEMMDKLRTATVDAGMPIQKFDGAGNLAHYLLKANGALTRETTEHLLPNGLLTMAHAAYYGGRFEVTRVGRIDGMVTECDLGSAYPAALQHVPCHEHGQWRKVSAETLQAALRDKDAVFVAPVAFHHPKSTFLCGLPFRTKQGCLIWPRDGRGTYWSVELRSARKLGCQITVDGEGWLYERGCDCRPYGWLRAAYDARKQLGKATKGIPLKLGINSVYGKRAQRVGGAPWQDPVHAGMTTAWTRARLNEAVAAADDPHDVVMLATDGIYYAGTAPDDMDYGKGLGQWETKRYPAGLFVVQPGLYWGRPEDPDTKQIEETNKVKSRGISPKFFEPVIPDFQRQWFNFIRRAQRAGETAVAHADDRSALAPPVVPVEVSAFISLRLAMHRKAFDTACQWVKSKRAIRFGWRKKRDHAELIGRSVRVGPRAGDPHAVSVPYVPDAVPDGLAEVFQDYQEARWEFEAMPDPIDLSPVDI